MTWPPLPVCEFDVGTEDVGVSLLRSVLLSLESLLRAGLLLLVLFRIIVV